MGDIHKMYSNTAELMFYIHSGQGASGFKSFLDNNEDGDQINSPEFFLIPMGYMALRKPNEQFENYIALRSKYEMLRYGILGSTIESADERKRLMNTLFDTIIRSSLFESGIGKESAAVVLYRSLPDGRSIHSLLLLFVCVVLKKHLAGFRIVI